MYRIIEDQGFRTKDIGSKDLIQHFSMISLCYRYAIDS